MTDAEKYVVEHWPHASCHGPVKLYWPGQGARVRFIVVRSPISSMSDGEGLTEVEAWADAANRLARKASAPPQGKLKWA